MKKLLISIAFALLLPYCLFAQAGAPLIELTGESSLKISPDIALVHFNVSAKGNLEHETLAKLNNQTQDLINKIEAAGFRKDQLRIINYYINENYVYTSGKQEKRGYIANQSIILRFPFDKDKLTDLFGKFASEKIVNTSINFSYELSKEAQKKAREQLIKEAITDARDKANVIADASGLRITGIRNILYNAAETPIRYDRAMEGNMSYMKESAAPAFSNVGVQEIELTERIRVSYAIEPVR